MNSIVERNIFKGNREVMEGGSVNAAKSNCDIQRKSILGPKGHKRQELSTQTRIWINIVILDLCDQSVILHLLISKTETYLNNIDITGKRPKCETFESNASAGLSKVAAFLRLPPYNNILQGRRFRTWISRAYGP